MVIKTLFIGIIPAVLVILGGVFVLRKGSRQAASRRFLFYLLFIGILLVSVVFFIEQISIRQDTWWLNQISIMTVPTMIGVMALIFVNLNLLAHLNLGEKFLFALLGLALLVLFVGSAWDEPFGRAQVTLSAVLVLASIWVFASKSDAIAFVISLIALVLMVVFNAGYLENSSSFPTWARQIIGFLIFILPGSVVALAAVWITSGFKSFFDQKAIRKTSNRPENWLLVVSRFGSAVLLLGYLAYTIVWASIWDQTSDGLSGVMFSTWASLTAIAAGMLISMTSVGWRRSAGLVFALFVPFLMFGSLIFGWMISYHAITEGRAVRIQVALENFYAENDRYPQELQELRPSYLLRIPQPVILHGEEWCYQGGKDFYRLGAFFREYFSTPLSLRIYAWDGNLPETGWPCEQRLSEMKARYDPPFFNQARPDRPTVEPSSSSINDNQPAPVQRLPDGKFVIQGN